MKFTQLLKFATFVIALPAFGVAVAASAFNTPAVDDAADTNTVTANSKFIGTDGRQDDESRANWVRLTANGTLNGRVSTIVPAGYRGAAGLKMNLVRNGQVLHSTHATSSGQFSFLNVEPGIYSLVGNGKQGFVSFGLYVLPAKGVGGGNVSTDAARDQIDVMATQYVGAVHSIIRQYLPGVELLKSEATQERVYAKVARQSFYQAASTERVDVYALADRVTGDEIPATTIRHQQIGLVDGRFTGSVGQIFGRPVDYASMAAFVIDSNRVLARSGIKDDGTFEISGVTPGVYGLIVASSNSFATIGIEVVEGGAGQASTDSNDGFQFVSMMKYNVANNLSLAPAQGDDVEVIANEDDGDDEEEEEEEEEEDDDPPPPQPVAPGGGGGNQGGGFFAIPIPFSDSGNGSGGGGDTTVAIPPASPTT